MWHPSQFGPRRPWWGSLWQVVQLPASPTSRTAIPRPAGKSASTFLWHSWQGAVACLPRKNPAGFLWAKVVTLKSDVVWQVSHLGPTCSRWTSLWQVTQAVPTPRYRTAVPWPAGKAAASFLWHFWHSVDECLPVSLKAAWSCRNAGDANFGAATVWQASHLPPSCPRWASLWQVTQSVGRFL